MYKKILVPLDGSERAEAILSPVTDLATCTQATIVLLQVIEREIVLVSPYDPLTSFAPEELNEQMVANAEAYLIEQSARLQRAGHSVLWRVERGSTVETIIAVADEENVDLIAMASHGRGGLTRMVFGSVANGVLQRAGQPLLLIRAR
jgi:nucleotide-binding universal stress UspA family protein